MAVWPKSIRAPTLSVKVEPLDQDAFEPFGTVVQNPIHAAGRASQPPPRRRRRELSVVEANQGSALKVLDVSHLTDHYGSAPSGRPARPVVNMFVCKPRTLRRRGRPAGVPAGVVARDQVARDVDVDVDGFDRVFDVAVLERHPHTPQTFVPMGVAAEDETTRYLVIVAPTLPDTAPPPSSAGVVSKVRSLLSLSWSSSSPSSPTTEPESSAPIPKGKGLPDLQNIRAFIAIGSQAVTYGPGTWHAPMVVLGNRPIDFVVLQYANGIGDEDCQEVLLQGDGGQGVSVVVDGIPVGQPFAKAKL